jgi:glutamate carboxypeptidase
MEQIRSYLEEKRDEMLGLIERLVNIDSGSFHKEGIDACGCIVAGQLELLGFETDVTREVDWGDHVRARRTGKRERRLFISAHLDTVFPVGTAAGHPFRIEGGLAYGPGAMLLT